MVLDSGGLVSLFPLLQDSLDDLVACLLQAYPWKQIHSLEIGGPLMEAGWEGPFIICCQE